MAECNNVESLDEGSTSKAPFSAVLVSSKDPIVASSLPVPHTAVDIAETSKVQCFQSDDEISPLSFMDVDELVMDSLEENKTKRKLPDDHKRFKKTKKSRSTNKEKSISPNAFVAIPVKSVSVSLQIEYLHHHMLQKEPKVRNILIPLNRLHITLMVMRLDDQESIER